MYETRLKDACNALVKGAREKCEACFWDAHPEMKKPMTYFGHTCKQEIMAAHNVAKAAIALVLHEWDGNEAGTIIKELLAEEA